MRFFVRLILVVFVLFLTTPTIVSVIKKSCDTSYFYNMSEEELAHKVVATSLCDSHFSPFIAQGEGKAAIISAPPGIPDPFSARILIPPPERI